MVLLIDPIIVLGVGLVLIVKFSDITVDNIIKFSGLTGINTMVIGFILLALGTSLPELAVVLASSSTGQGIIGLSTLFGSNIADIVILGIVALLIPFRIPKEDQKSLTQVVIVTSAISILALLIGRISLIFGVFTIIIFYLISKPIVNEGTRKSSKLKNFNLIKPILLILFSLAVVLLSASFVSEAIIDISKSLNIYESFFGASLIAFSTSLPELTVSLSAVRKRNLNLAVGNIIGSLMINLTLFLGIGAIISTIILDPPTIITIYISHGRMSATTLARSMLFLFTLMRLL